MNEAGRSIETVATERTELRNATAPSSDALWSPPNPPHFGFSREFTNEECPLMCLLLAHKKGRRRLTLQFNGYRAIESIHDPGLLSMDHEIVAVRSKG
jgi:hypothetical protein